MRIVILDSYTVDQGDLSVWRPFADLGELAVHPRTAPEELAARIAGAEALITNKVALKEADMGPALRYIGVTATGVNVVDLEAARRRGVAVANVPGYGADSVAQHVFALIFHLALDVAGHGADVKAGRWAASPDFCFTRQPLPELKGKTLVLLGGGAIGTAVAGIARAFGMRVLFARVPGSATPDRAPLEQALPQADFVSLHCPLTGRNRGFVDAAFFAAMKPGAILVNTSRGPLVDEAALIAALAGGRLGGAALDVLAVEPPPPDHPLLDPAAPWARRVVVTPHIAWATVEARARLLALSLGNLRAFLQGEARNRVA